MEPEQIGNEGVRELWQGQKTEGVQMSMEQIQKEAGRFQRRIQWRNRREYVISIAMTLFFWWLFLLGHDVLVRVGCGLVIGGNAYMVWHLLSKGSLGVVSENAGFASWIEFRRRELIRQRDLLNGIWHWNLGPLVPGLLVLIAAFARFAATARSSIKHPGVLVAVDLLVFIVAFAAIGRLNARCARKLQRQIEELDRQSGTGQA
ncbi:MAG TPA: hypothetical protein VII58_10570 [Acidobacteriaceae bacterium]